MLKLEPEFQVAHLTTVHSRFDIRIFRKMAVSTSKEGIRTAIVVADGNGPCAADGVSIVDVGKSSNRLLRAIVGNWRVFRATRNMRPSLAHIHDPELIPAGLLITAFCASTRVLYDAHEDAPNAIRTKVWIPRALRPIAAWSVHLMERAAHQFFAGIVTATPAIGAKFHTERVTVVQNFPIIGELVTPQSSPKPERPIFAYVGGVTEIRGSRQMVEAAKKIADQADIHVAGVFMPANLSEEVKGMGIVQLGQISRAEVASLLDKASAGLVLFQSHPNHINSQPNKLFEYMSANLPVIASNFPLWREIIEGNNCGLCVDPADPKAIAGAMAWILENPEAATAMGTAGREAVLTKFNWDSQFKHLLACYSQFIEFDSSLTRQ